MSIFNGIFRNVHNQMHISGGVSIFIRTNNLFSSIKIKTINRFASHNWITYAWKHERQKVDCGRKIFRDKKSALCGFYAIFSLYSCNISLDSWLFCFHFSSASLSPFFVPSPNDNTNIHWKSWNHIKYHEELLFMVLV